MDAGLFIRIIDHLTDMDDWEDGAWLPSKNPNRADRFSGSVINRRVPFIFMGKHGRGAPGFVLSSAAAYASLFCGFTHDTGTVMAQCHPPGLSYNCSPGCMGASMASRNTSHWCDSPDPCHGLGGECHVATGGRYSYPTCPWPSEKLDQLMAMKEAEVAGATCECCHWTDDDNDCSLYNELIFSTALLAGSPAVAIANIEAVFFPAERAPWVERFARQVHGSLIEHRDVPLARYNALVDADAPAFTLVE